MEFKSQYYLVDIDGTLTDYRKGVLNAENFLHGNFLFSTICDVMLENGWDRKDAENAIFELTEKITFWDYSDFIAEFNLPVKETLQRLSRWHHENLEPYSDVVKIIRALSNEGRKLFIMSNNPYMGCVFKLQAAGLADDDFRTPYFQRIFGTNILRGCKCVPGVWKRALAQIPADASEIGVIGDNPHEDGEIPRSLGIIDTIIIRRAEIAHGIENMLK